MYLHAYTPRWLLGYELALSLQLHTASAGAAFEVNLVWSRSLTLTRDRFHGSGERPTSSHHSPAMWVNEPCTQRPASYNPAGDGTGPATLRGQRRSPLLTPAAGGGQLMPRW